MARIAAACAMLDRGFGKPKVMIEGNGDALPFTRIERVIVTPKAERAPSRCSLVRTWVRPGYS